MASQRFRGYAMLMRHDSIRSHMAYDHHSNAEVSQTVHNQSSTGTSHEETALDCWQFSDQMDIFVTTLHICS